MLGEKVDVADRCQAAGDGGRFGPAIRLVCQERRYSLVRGRQRAEAAAGAPLGKDASVGAVRQARRLGFLRLGIGQRPRQIGLRVLYGERVGRRERQRGERNGHGSFLPEGWAQGAATLGPAQLYELADVL